MKTAQPSPQNKQIMDSPQFKQFEQKFYSKYPKGTPVDDKLLAQIKQMFAQAGFPGFGPLYEKPAPMDDTKWIISYTQE
jgi:hypothetical protein